MTDISSFDYHRLNSFEERLKQVQADVSFLKRNHDDLRLEVKRGFDTMGNRFDTLEFRLETMIAEMRRFFSRYEHVSSDGDV